MTISFCSLMAAKIRHLKNVRFLGHPVYPIHATRLPRCSSVRLSWLGPVAGQLNSITVVTYRPPITAWRRLRYSIAAAFDDVINLYGNKASLPAPVYGHWTVCVRSNMSLGGPSVTVVAHNFNIQWTHYRSDVLAWRTCFLPAPPTYTNVFQSNHRLQPLQSGHT